MPEINNIVTSVKGKTSDVLTDLTVGFKTELYRAKLQTPLLRMGNATVRINNGVVYVDKFGADEILLDANATDFDKYSNLNNLLSIPFTDAIKTNPIRFSKLAYAQLGKDALTINKSQLKTKADKLSKFRTNYLMKRLIEGQTDKTHKADGPIKVITASVSYLDSQDWPAIGEIIDQAIEDIMRIGIKDKNGNDQIDKYRTGVDTTTFKIITSPKIKKIYNKWRVVQNRDTSYQEKNQYGNWADLPLLVDPYLPYVGVKYTPDLSTPTNNIDKNYKQIIKVEDTNEYAIHIMVVKENTYWNGIVVNETYDTEISLSTDRAVGFIMKFGAGTVWADENFAITFNGEPLKQLNTVITVKDLGEFTFTSAIPTPAELDAQVKVKNSGYTVNNAIYSNITATSATMTGTGIYTGQETLVFSKQI